MEKMEYPEVLSSDCESLNDEQIRDLLQSARARLLQKSPLPETSLSQMSPSLPSLEANITSQTCINFSKGAVRVDSSYIRKQQDREIAKSVKVVETNSSKKQRIKKENEATAGPNWFHLPRTNLTPELKRDFQLLKMRSILDPKRHYKKENGRMEPPTFSQVGTIIESPAEYYSARLPNKQRRKTLVDEVLAAESENHRFKIAYNKAQAAKTSGKKRHYKIQKAKRSGKFKR